MFQNFESTSNNEMKLNVNNVPDFEHVREDKALAKT